VFQSSDEMLATTGPPWEIAVQRNFRLYALQQILGKLPTLFCCTVIAPRQETFTAFLTIDYIGILNSTGSLFTASQCQASILGQTRIEYLSEIEFRDAV
jgi:hypothetical protein